MAETKKAERLPNKFEACLPVLVLLGLMVANSVLKWGNDPHLYVLRGCEKKSVNLINC